MPKYVARRDISRCPTTPVPIRPHNRLTASDVISCMQYYCCCVPMDLQLIATSILSFSIVRPVSAVSIMRAKLGE